MLINKRFNWRAAIRVFIVAALLNPVWTALFYVVDACGGKIAVLIFFTIVPPTIYAAVAGYRERRKIK